MGAWFWPNPSTAVPRSRLVTTPTIETDFVVFSVAASLREDSVSLWAQRNFVVSARHRQPAELATPLVLIVFDLLYVKGRDVSQCPLRDRLARLEARGPRPTGSTRCAAWRRTA